MKKGLLIGGGIVGVLLVVVVAAAVFLLSNVNSIVKAAVEKVGSDVTGTQVSLADVDIELASGSGSLQGFRMTNPKGFSDADAFKFEEVKVTLDLATIQSDPIVVKEILVAGPEVTYEFGKDQSNIEAVQGNVGQAAPAQDGGAEESAGGEGPKLVIENLILRDGKIRVTATGLTDEGLSAPLPDIHMTDIGKESQGATPGEVAVAVLDTVLGQVSAAVGKIDPARIAEALGSDVEGIAGALGKGAGSAVESVSDTAGGAVKDVTEGADEALKNLLGGKD